jgi:predicted nucleotidyltransferase
MSNKIINQLIETKNHPLYGREIARISKKNQKTVQASLQRFEDKGVLSKQIVGKNYLYTINTKNKNVIYSLIAAEIEKTREFLDNNFEIKELVADVRDMTNEPVLIFGSYAKGNQTKESDVDVIVLDTKINLEKIKHKYTKKIHLITMTKNQFIKDLKKKVSLLQETILNHIIIQDFTFFTKRWLEQHG